MARTVDFRLWKGIAKANKRTTKQEQAVGRREAQQNCYGLERLKVLSREGLGSSGNCRNWIDTSESRWQYVEALNWEFLWSSGNCRNWIDKSGSC
ncbi:hypothetical protein GPALN_007785 [Globodera pallida]|nr:hypothetical protein GPALN_007785 [Globodera pallida]